MQRFVKISNFAQVSSLAVKANEFRANITVRDQHKTVADAKSILGLMCLDYNSDVCITSEDERALRDCISAVS